MNAMLELVYNLKKRSNMYLLDETYNGLVSFIMGYQFAVLQNLKEDNSDKFQNWLRQKFEIHFSVHWSIFILNEMSDKDEFQARIYLLDLLEEFLKG